MSTRFTTFRLASTLFATLSQCLVFQPYATESDVQTTVQVSTVTAFPSMQRYGYVQDEILFARQVGDNFQTCGYISEDYGRPVTCDLPQFCAYQTGANGNYGPGCCTDLNNCIRATTCLDRTANTNTGPSFINKKSSLLCGSVRQKCATRYQEGINRGETSPLFTHYYCDITATEVSVYQTATNLPTTVVSTAVSVQSVSTADPSTVVSVSVVTATPTSTDPTTTSTEPTTTSTTEELTTSTLGDSSASQSLGSSSPASTSTEPIFTTPSASPSPMSSESTVQVASSTPTPASTPTPTSTPAPSNKAAIGGGVGGAIGGAILLGAVTVALLMRRKRKQRQEQTPELAS
nr:hypothetical protein B0A51_16544 [Rachicladosporium sp. CCFEE 5018]